MKDLLKGLDKGAVVYNPPTAYLYKTGTWRTQTPTFYKEKCRNCYLCYFWCPEGAIKVNLQKEIDHIDYDYCKGCGICVESCPAGAINIT